MPAETKYFFSLQDLQPHINDGAAVLLDALERDGLLTKPAKEISAEYAVLVVERGAIGRVWDKLVGKEEKARYVAVRLADVNDAKKEKS